MSADPIVYCLENLTDYSQFERLASDVMNATGYIDIEPLGGTSDRGRDALFAGKDQQNASTIFAYSVREDWKVKLRSDCERIKDEEHDLENIVFVCTATISATERDAAVEKVKESYGWRLELYGLERLRVRLAGDARQLVPQHAAIFTPPFFPTQGGLPVGESHDTLIIDHVSSDHALATWLARRLQLCGYKTWCYGTAPLAGENADKSVRTLIDKRAVRYLPVISAVAMQDADLMARCGLAANTESLVLPCFADAFDSSRLPTPIKNRVPCHFDERWSTGLGSVVAALEGDGVPLNHDKLQGKAIALRAFVPIPVVKESPETIYTNTFPIQVPGVLRVFRLKKKLTQREEADLRKTWPFVHASPQTLLAFDYPPNSIELKSGSHNEDFYWPARDRWGEKPTGHLVRSLLYRSMEIACIDAGMRWCEKTRRFFFPTDVGPHHKVHFSHVDGRKTHVVMTGEITWGSGESKKPYRYQVCPSFRVSCAPSGEWWLTLRLYIRVTSQDGKPFEGKEIARRRRKVTKSWWNNKFLARTVAMMQAISNGQEQILVGTEDNAVRFDVHPQSWDCPVALDYKALSSVGDFQEEMSERSSWEEDEADAN